MEFKALGKRVTEFIGFETFPKPLHVTRVRMVSDEVTAVCPVTGQPDWYKVTIEYYPVDKCLESKSLKLYLQSFRNQGHFCEQFANIIAEDIYKALEPKLVVVEVEQKPRGGVAINAKAIRGEVT
jgi:7-cyano-7-deazaguanine reductase